MAVFANKKIQWSENNKTDKKNKTALAGAVLFFCVIRKNPTTYAKLFYHGFFLMSIDIGMKFETTIEKKKALAHVRFDWMWDSYTTEGCAAL